MSILVLEVSRFRKMYARGFLPLRYCHLGKGCIRGQATTCVQEAGFSYLSRSRLHHFDSQ